MSENSKSFTSASMSEMGFSRAKLMSVIRRRIEFIQRTYHEELVELSFVQSGALLIDFHSWRNRRSQEIMQALCSGHLDPDDLSMVSNYMSGLIPTDVFFPSYGCSSSNHVASETEADSEGEERGLDETSIYRLAMNEVNVLKRVMQLKQAGLWSVDQNILDTPELANTTATPSMSSLAPPPENATRVFSDYLFAELHWLAEDFKRERQWKKSSAKKLALAAVKAYREKTERSLKAEREEVVRVRKLCGLIARMVRDWWRQIDKIVQAKQKARLTVKRQQAITTHLGRVLETTEEYTRWLTEGIAGASATQPATTAVTSDSTSDMPESEVMSETAAVTATTSGGVSKGSKRHKRSVSNTIGSSDSEFTADEAMLAAAEDDEETIAREEAEAAINTNGDLAVSAEAELAQLAADADCPIEDLIPPGYLEACMHESPCKSEEHVNAEKDEDNKSTNSADRSYEAGEASDAESDDESTIEAQERHERQIKRAQQKAKVSDSPIPSNDTPLDQAEEIAQLELEATMPLEDLLERFVTDQKDASPMDTDAEVSESELTSSTQGSDTTTSSGEESDDDRTTLTDGSSESSLSSSDEASLRELLSDDVECQPQEVDQPKVEIQQSDASQSCECTTKTPINPAHAEAEMNLETLTSEALKAQPTGNTLAAGDTNVTVPFLLTGGSLREYQLVGLTWLAAIFQKRLNGILADEMGLGKTIQTIALLAYLACEHGIWGPHLIVVPTSVILNWEIEFKRWCPGFKILTYFGHAKERKERRKGWTKTNAFHVCITSYRLAIQDATVFKRKKWKYLILDEAQNIKNFKSQRWQTLLTFNSQRRLLLTGTPLQNSLMELWSLMHFLMPNIFQSHRDFQEWFASPLTGMIEGNSEYNEQLVARLHKVLRPFLLRRLKADVERQMPKKFEHVVMCRLSRRQRFLYDDFMSLTSTRETLKSGQFLSVMNVLMQLRKVCNHPNLFETRPIISSFHVAGHLLQWELPRLLSEISHPFLVLAPTPNGGSSPVANASAFTEPHLDWLDRAGAAARLLGQMSNLAEMARDLPTFVAHRCRNLCARSDLITVVDSMGVVDDVHAQRKTLSAIAKKFRKSDVDVIHRKAPFLTRSCIKQVNEELLQHVKPGQNRFPYPSLPTLLPVDPVFVEAPPPCRPGNSGMPKSVLRSRGVERQRRLAFIGRINERRCDIVQPIEHHTATFDSNEFSTRIGPDIVHLVTRMLRSSRSSSSTTAYSIYPGLVEGQLRCRRSLTWWPSRSSVSNRAAQQSRIQQAACIPTLTSSRQPFVTEAPWARHYVCDQDCMSLRMLLANPADHLDTLSDVLQRFAFFVPAAISSGFQLHVSCARYQSQHSRQDERLTSLLQSDCLPAVCVPQDDVTNRIPRSSYDHIPLSPQAWLLPVQLHRIASACRIQFPDPRLIQYDCGKLQRLDLLLRELKSGQHRVLIFTQMARMLDILEQFLAFHGHRYLRLDGTTKVEQRQVLMERFNQDASIFVFILSTRSGGLGVNLTGADTVIFYDSDWNPTMDAQAQDRCHRIGQTRDVHIYRLISELTVEENILRKANQKRFLSDVAIEGGRFTTAFFKQNTIDELFAEPSGLQDLVLERQRQEAMMNRENLAVSTQQRQQPEVSSDNSDSKPVQILITRSGRQVRPRGDAATIAALAPPPTSTPPPMEETQLAALLEACEDENDRIAAKRALDEAKAELAEFDETIPLEDNTHVRSDGPLATETTMVGTNAVDEPDPLTQYALKKQKIRAQSTATATTTTTLQPSSTTGSAVTTDLPATEEDGVEQVVERELAEFEAALRPIERFGIRNLEEQREHLLNEELVQAEVQLNESKEAWRLDQLKALHVADEERAEIEEDDMLYCYGNYDPRAQLAELERLERLIAQEEEQSVNPEPIRPRGRVNFTGRSKAGTKRGRLSNRSSAHATDSSATELAEAGEDSTGEQFPSSKRVATDVGSWGGQRNNVETGDSDDDDDDDDEYFKFGSETEPTPRRVVESQVNQRWEQEKPSSEDSDDGLPSEAEEEDWGARLSRRLSNVKSKSGAEKRKRPSISFFLPQKISKVVDSTTPVKTNRRSIPIPESGVFRRERFRPGGVASRPTTITTSVEMGISPTFGTSDSQRPSPKQFVIKDQGMPDRTSSVGSQLGQLTQWPGYTNSPMHDEASPIRRTSDRSIFEAIGIPRLPSPANTARVFERSNYMERLSTPSNPPASGIRTPNKLRMDGFAPAFNHLKTPNNQSPRMRPATPNTPSPRQSASSSSNCPARTLQWPTSGDTFMIPVPQPATVYARKVPPPSAQTPPEPMIPVQSILNGTRESIPAGQLFTPTGQPVFVITRQMKTASGEVYQQRFTHPVIPPPQFVRVVNRLAQSSPHNPAGRATPTVTPRNIAPALSPVGRFASPSPNSIPKGSLSNLGNRDVIASQIGTTASNPVDQTAISSVSGPTRFVTVTSATSSAIPIIRRLNCEVAQPTPVLRLINTDLRTTASPSLTQSLSTSVPLIRPLTQSVPRTALSQSGQQQQHTMRAFNPRSIPTQVVHARLLPKPPNTPNR